MLVGLNFYSVSVMRQSLRKSDTELPDLIDSRARSLHTIAWREKRVLVAFDEVLGLVPSADPVAEAVRLRTGGSGPPAAFMTFRRLTVPSPPLYWRARRPISIAPRVLSRRAPG